MDIYLRDLVPVILLRLPCGALGVRVELLLLGDVLVVKHGGDEPWEWSAQAQCPMETHAGMERGMCDKCDGLAETVRQN